MEKRQSMAANTGKNRIPEEKIEYLRMYRYSTIDPDVLPWNIPSIREKLKDYGDNEEVRKLDKWLLEDLKGILKVNTYFKDDNTQPLEKWWWHLHKIANGTYPIELLPNYLKNVSPQLK